MIIKGKSKMETVQENVELSIDLLSKINVRHQKQIKVCDNFYIITSKIGQGLTFRKLGFS